MLLIKPAHTIGCWCGLFTMSEEAKHILLKAGRKG